MGKTEGVGGAGGGKPIHPAVTTPKALEALTVKVQQPAFKTLNRAVEMWKPATDKRVEPQEMSQSVSTDKPSGSKSTAKVASKPLHGELKGTNPGIIRTGKVGVTGLNAKGQHLLGIALKTRGSEFPTEFEAEIGPPDDATQVGQRVFGGNEGILKRLKLPHTDEDQPPAKKHKAR